MNGDGEGFVYLWELYHNSWIAGCLISAVLSLVGVFVVARDQIFLGAAVSQASTLGVAIALAVAAGLGGSLSWVEEAGVASFLAVVFSILAAVVTAHVGTRGKETYEAITGWVFLVSASLSILILSFSPRGTEEIHHLLFSSILVAELPDVLVFAVLASLTAIAILLLHRRLLLFTLDPVMASAVGMRRNLWTLCTYAWLGLAVGLSLRASGLLYTFGCLVLPPLVAKNLTREVGPMFLVAPAVALGPVVVGFAIELIYDLPSAQTTVALLALSLPLAWALRRPGVLRRRETARGAEGENRDSPAASRQ